MFSLLMSVYYRESPAALATALQSIRNQTLAPSEIVLVKDGPLNPELDAVIETYAALMPLKIVVLPKNIGLAGALNAGLHETQEPWIMRFDTDDFCVAERIEIQARRAERGDVDVFGAQIAEFEKEPAQLERSRQVPCTHQELAFFARRRNPFNHMTVCYRREAVLAVGGYPNIHLMEDYGLWMTLLARGARFANCPETLVLARTGNGMPSRRGGFSYVRSEFNLQAHMRTLGLKTALAASLDGALRSAVFLSPVGLRKVVYNRLLRKEI